MKLLLKIYEHEFDDTIITQEIIDGEVEIEEDLQDFSIAKFRLPLIKIEEYNIIEIYEVANTDNRIFRGYVYKVKPIWRQFGMIDIICRGEKAIMNDRKVLSDKNYVAQDIGVILEDLLGDYSVYGEDRDWETDFVKDINIELKEGDTYFDVIDELAKQCKVYRTIIDKKLIFKKNISTDRTTGDNYQEIVYNGLFPNTANIGNIDVVGTATRCNIVIGRGQDDTKHTADNYTDRLYGVKLESFREGDIVEKTEKELENSDRSQRIYQVDTEQNSLIANVGDKIRLTVENTNSYYDIDSDVFVIAKTTTYNNGSKQVKFKIGELDLRVLNDRNWFFDVQKNLRLLKTK